MGGDCGKDSLFRVIKLSEKRSNYLNIFNKGNQGMQKEEYLVTKYVL